MKHLEIVRVEIYALALAVDIKSSLAELLNYKIFALKQACNGIFLNKFDTVRSSSHPYRNTHNYMQCKPFEWFL